MNFVAALVFILLSVSGFVNDSPSCELADKTPKQVLKQIIDKLRSIQRVKYNYYRDVSYASEGVKNELSGKVYVEFEPTNIKSDFRFQFETDEHVIVYSGIKFFRAEKKEKKIIVTSNPTSDDYSQLSMLYNSVITLRKGLNTICADEKIIKTLGDTTINEKAYHIVSFVLQNQTLGKLGNLSPLSSQRAITYRIIADKVTKLPFQVIQTNNIDTKDYVLTQFTDYEVNGSKPEESIWHYLTYAGSYKVVVNR